MAVSPIGYESPGEAEQAFENLLVAGPRLTARITHVRDGIGWVWVVPGTRGLPEIRSSRPYERYATCQNAFRRFLVLLAKLAAPPAVGPGPAEEEDPLRSDDAR